MAEGTQKEDMNTAAMEENSLDTDGEGVEKEKHSNEQGEIEGRYKKTITDSSNDETTKNFEMNDINGGNFHWKK